MEKIFLLPIAALSLSMTFMGGTEEYQPEPKTQAEATAIACMKEAGDDLDKQRICSVNFMKESQNG